MVTLTSTCRFWPPIQRGTVKTGHVVFNPLCSQRCRPDLGSQISFIDLTWFFLVTLIQMIKRQPIIAKLISFKCGLSYFHILRPAKYWNALELDQNRHDADSIGSIQAQFWQAMSWLQWPACATYVLNQRHLDFVHQLVKADNKQATKSPHYGSFARGIHRKPWDSPHKGPAMLKTFPYHDVIIWLPVYKSRHSWSLDPVHFKDAQFLLHRCDDAAIVIMVAHRCLGIHRYLICAATLRMSEWKSSVNW